VKFAAVMLSTKIKIEIFCIKLPWLEALKCTCCAHKLPGDIRNTAWFTKRAFNNERSQATPH